MKNTLKITVFSAILLILAGGLVSCEKEKEIPTSSVSVINVKIPYDNNYDDFIVAVKLLVNSERMLDTNSQQFFWQGTEIAQADFRDGSFTMNLPDNVNSLELFDMSFPSSIKMSEKNVMHTIARLVAYNEDGEQVGYFTYIHFFFCDESIVEGGLMYFDRDFTIIGSDVSTAFISTASCNFKRGWNYVFTISRRNSAGVQLGEVTTSEPNCMHWNFKANNY